MQLNTKLVKAAFIAGIIALILIGFYAINEKDASQGQTISSASSEQLQTYARDPFKEHLEKQQQGATSQSTLGQHSQPIQIANGNSTTAVPVGTDPFKAFLDAQSKAKPEEAGISPFATGK